MKKTTKVLMCLCFFPILSCAQNKKENNNSTVQTKTNKQFIEALVCEPVYKFCSKEKEIIIPSSIIENGMFSPFLDKNQNPKYDEMNNLLNGISYRELKGKKIIFTGIVNNEYLFNIHGREYKIIVANKSQLANREFYNLFDADYVQKIKKGLEGKTLFTQTSEWIYKTKDKNDYEVNTTYEIENDKSCQFCPVTITHVEKEQSNDYAVYFKHENDPQEYKFDIVLDTDRSYGIPVDLERKNLLNF